MAASHHTLNTRGRKVVKKANKFVKRIENILQKSSATLGIEISDVVLGGSIGQRTMVVDNCDMDIVIFSRSLHPSRGKVYEDEYKTILSKLFDCLQESIKDIYAPRAQKPMLHGWRFQAGPFQVDLQLSPQWKEPNYEDMYDYIKDFDNAVLFGSGTAQFIVDLMRRQPGRVRRFIIAFKAWRDDTWDDKGGQPKSYFCSLLVLISYHRSPPQLGPPGRVITHAEWITEDLKKLVKSIHTNSNDLDLRVPGENPIIRTKYSKDLPDCPRIIDPANPFKNFYKQGLAWPN